MKIQFSASFSPSRTVHVGHIEGKFVVVRRQAEKPPWFFVAKFSQLKNALPFHCYTRQMWPGLLMVFQGQLFTWLTGGSVKGKSALIEDLTKMNSTLNWLKIEIDWLN